MNFNCLHCGRCCVNICTQINVTLGDIKRISNFMNVPIESLFEKQLGINPFGSPENENVYDYELGLNIPCSFRVNKRCIIYEARPLNCRLFPYWILANAPGDRIKNLVDDSHKCMAGFDFDEKDRLKYRQFFNKLSKLLLEESEITDTFMEKNSFKDSIVLDKCASSEEKIKICISLLDKKRYKNLIPLLKKELETQEFASLEEVKKIHEFLG